MIQLTANERSTLLYKLAEKVGNVTNEEKSVERTVLNVCEMTVVNQEKSIGLLTNVFEMNDTEDFYDDYVNCDGIVVKSGVGNDEVIVRWELGVYTKLKELIIGDMCFVFMNGLELKGMNMLEKVEIGNGCFSKAEGTFEVSDCKKLKRVSIGDDCFVNCERTVFENLNELQSLTIGAGCMNGNESVVVMKSG